MYLRPLTNYAVIAAVSVWSYYKLQVNCNITR